MPNVTYSGSEGLRQTSGTGGFQVNDAAVLEDQDDVLAREIFTIQCVAETLDDDGASELDQKVIRITDVKNDSIENFYIDTDGNADPGVVSGDNSNQVDVTGKVGALATADEVGAALATAIDAIDGLSAASSAGSEGAASDLVTVTQAVVSSAQASAVGNDGSTSGFTYTYTTEGSSAAGANALQAFGNTKITMGASTAATVAVLGSPAAGASAVGQKKLIVRTDGNVGACAISVSNHETSDPEVFTFTAADEYLLLVWTGTEWATLAGTATT